MNFTFNPLLDLYQSLGERQDLSFIYLLIFPTETNPSIFGCPKTSVQYITMTWINAVRVSLKFIKKRFGNILLDEDWIVNEDRRTIFYAKSDLLSAFRILPIFQGHRKYLIMAAENHKIPGRLFFFSDKLFPFGASILCSHFTRFSNALRHIVEKTTNKDYQMSNYLDNFLFLSDTEEECNNTSNIIQVTRDCFKPMRMPVESPLTKHFRSPSNLLYSFRCKILVTQIIQFLLTKWHVIFTSATITYMTKFK